MYDVSTSLGLPTEAKWAFDLLIDELGPALESLGMDFDAVLLGHSQNSDNL